MSRESTFESKDDFKEISGIGATIDHRLHTKNIHTYDQLAAMQPEDIISAVAPLVGLSTERIVQQDWIGQARQLAINKRAASKPTERQRYATFKVELLFDEENQVRRTQIVYIQKDKQDAWSGWDEVLVLKFIARHAGLALLTGKPGTMPRVVSELEHSSEQVESGPVVLGRPQTVLRENDNSPVSIVAHSQFFKVNVHLDVGQVAVETEDKTLNYTVCVFAKHLSRGERIALSKANGTINPGQKQTILMEGVPLQRGIYRLEAAANVTCPSDKSELTAFSEGSMLQIY